MTDEILTGASTDAETAGPAFTVEKLYVKDVSFEVPGAPAVFNEQTQPQLQMNLNQSVQRLNDNAYEVVLGITLTCNAGDKPMYLVEVKQAGIFEIRNVPAEQKPAVIGIVCPGIVYPYLRANIADLITRTGLPPINLAEINFEAFYQQRMAAVAQQRTQTVAAPATNGNGAANA